MNALNRFVEQTKADMWRPDDRRIHVRKRGRGLGYTINLHALRERARALRARGSR